MKFILYITTAIFSNIKQQKIGSFIIGVFTIDCFDISIITKYFHKIYIIIILKNFEI